MWTYAQNMSHLNQLSQVWLKKIDLKPPTRTWQEYVPSGAKHGACTSIDLCPAGLSQSLRCLRSQNKVSHQHRPPGPDGRRPKLLRKGSQPLPLRSCSDSYDYWIPFQKKTETATKSGLMWKSLATTPFTVERSKFLSNARRNWDATLLYHWALGP